MRKLLYVLLLVALALPAPAMAAQPTASEIQSPTVKFVAPYDPQNVTEDGRIPYYVRYVPGQRDTVARAAEALGGSVTHDINMVETISINLPAAALSALANNPHVAFMEPVPIHYLLESVDPVRVTDAQAPDAPVAPQSLEPQVVPFNIDQFQARDVWDANRDGVVDPGAPDGSGIKFCIIDTGLYQYHEDFQGVTVSGVSQITGEEYWQDGNGHGTHVAGTANAVNNSYGVVGVAPGGMELYSVKIFNFDGVWVTGQSNLGAAAQLCRDAGANVLSMSLGGSYSLTENNIFQGLYDNDDILNIAAAGNDGNNVASYPASYDSVISVAAIDSDEVVAEFSQFPSTAYNPLSPPSNSEWDVVELSGGGVQVLSTVPYLDVTSIVVDGVTYSGYIIEYASRGTVSGEMVDGGLCGSTGSWSGKVVLCERGTYDFNTKVTNVENSGGVAAVIYNNAPGNFYGTLGDGNSSDIVAISLTQEDGQYLVANKLGQVGTVSSTYTWPASGYEYYNGTSMATPGVAAGVAWAWNACGGPVGISNKDLRLLLRDTAKDLIGTSPGGVSYGAGWDPYTGWGLVQLKDALDEGNVRYGSTCPIQLSVDPDVLNVCTLSATSINTTVTLDDRFTGTSNLSIVGVPAGASSGFSPNQVAYPATQSILSLSSLNTATAGIYALTVTAVDAGDPGNNASKELSLTLVDSLPDEPINPSPADSAIGVNLQPTFSWDAVDGATGYTFWLDDDPDFSSPLAGPVARTTSSYALPFTLNTDTLYYWKVTTTNLCGTSTALVAAFKTTAESCSTVAGSTGTIAKGSTTSFDLVWMGSGPVSDVNVLGLTGSIGGSASVGNLGFTLVNPDGEYPASVLLKPAGCGTTGTFDFNLDDDVGDTMNCAVLNSGATYQPDGSLSDFDLSEVNGTWQLRITNSSKNQDGSLSGWELQICTAPIPSADYSDSPGSYGVAWHEGDGTIRLGTNWTADASFGDGDDDITDDGVTRTGPWITDGSTTVNVNVTGSAVAPWLAGWVDWDGSGDFSASELVYDDAVIIGNNPILITIPSEYVTGTTVRARWRVYDGAPAIMSDASPTGDALSGETEDYEWEFTPTAVDVLDLQARMPDYAALLWLAGGVILLTVSGWWLLRRRTRA